MTRAPLVIALLAVLSATAACTGSTAPSSSPSLTQSPAPAPTQSSCAFNVPQDAKTTFAGPDGGTFSFNVTTGQGCAWTAVSNSDFLRVTSAPSAGPGVVEVSVAANSGTQRSGTLTIAGATVTIAQVSASCRFSVSPPATRFPADGGDINVSVLVTQGLDCSWGVVVSDSFITVKSGVSGTGSGSVQLSASANAGGERTGVVTIAGQVLTFSQASHSCVYRVIGPGALQNGANVAAIGVRVIQGSGCSWAVTAADPAITIKGSASGTGDGDISFTVAPNPSTETRVVSLTVAGQTISMTQDGRCVFSMSPASFSVPAGGQAITINITSNHASCFWAADYNSLFISAQMPWAGTGNGSITYVVEPNTGPARSGTIALGGLEWNGQDPMRPFTFAVSQTGR